MFNILKKLNKRLLKRNEGLSFVAGYLYHKLKLRNVACAKKAYPGR